MKILKRTGFFTGAVLPLIVSTVVFAPSATGGPIIVGHAAGNSAIRSWDFATGGAPTASFFPQSTGDGRGIEVDAGLVYYTKVGTTTATPAIHIAPYNNGAGGADIGSLPNPRPGFNIQDLDVFNGSLYALTGYLPGPTPGPLIVYQMNLANGQIQNSVTIQGANISATADGFTVLPNGNFLINDFDASNRYRQYSSTTGLVVPSAPVITVASPTNRATGVDYFSNSLYFWGVFFSSGGLGMAGLVNTDLGGNEISRIQIGPNSTIEDISVIPEPGSMLVAAAAAILVRRRRT